MNVNRFKDGSRLKIGPYGEAEIRLYLAWFCLASQLLGMMLAPWVQSASMFGLTILVLWELIRERVDFPTRWQAFVKRPDLWILAIFMLLPLLSAFDVPDPEYFWERLKTKVPFFLMPWVYFMLPDFSRRQFMGLLYYFLFLLSIVGLGILVHYFFHFQEAQLELKEGRHIPMPANHIRFSSLVAMGVFVGFFLWLKGYFWKKSWEKHLIAGLTLFLLAFLHFIAVRSGLLALYFAILVLGLRHIYLSGRYVYLFLLLIGVFLLPFLALKTMPSLQEKLNYTLYDLEQYRNGNATMHSDSERLRTLQVGWYIFQSAPWLGVGAGNLRREVEFQYQTHFPDTPKVMIPHNQFLFVMAGSGIFGLVLFLIGLFLPLFFRKNYVDDLLLAHYCMSVAAFMVEASIDNAMGVAVFNFFLLLFLKYPGWGRFFGE
jgi:O-antigen ligase